MSVSVSISRAHARCKQQSERTSPPDKIEARSMGPRVARLLCPEPNGEWSRGDFEKFQNALAELEAVVDAFQKERLEPKVV